MQTSLLHQKKTAADVSLRSAAAEDEEFLYRVYASTRADEMALTDWTEAQKEAFLRMQSNAQRQSYLAQYPQAEYSVIAKDGAPIGRLIVDRTGRDLLLMDIALLPEYRNAGIGTRLIEELLDEADRTARPVRLHVETFNPAMNLYKRLGFIETGELSFYHEMTRQPQAGEEK